MTYLTLPNYDIENQDDHPLGGRHYKTEFGWVGSVTTKLQRSKDMTSLNEWRAWKGEEQADLILKVAGGRGSKLHKIVENYLLTQKKPKFCLLAGPYWNSIRPFILKIKHSTLIEGAVWHPDGFAGKLDHLGYHKDDGGLISLNDWKSAEKPANEEKLYDYKLQVAAYVAAAEYVYRDFGLLIPRARIVIAIPDAECQVEVLNRDQLKQLFIHFQARNRYANSNPLLK